MAPTVDERHCPRLARESTFGLCVRKGQSIGGNLLEIANKSRRKYDQAAGVVYVEAIASSWTSVWRGHLAICSFVAIMMAYFQP